MTREEQIEEAQKTYLARVIGAQRKEAAQAFARLSSLRTRQIREEIMAEQRAAAERKQANG